jgi:antitoxin ParD1/3/4
MIDSCYAERPMGKPSTVDVASFSAESYNALMAQMNISIPEKLKGWAESRVAEGRHSSISDYVRDLIRRDQENEEKLRRLQAAIDEGRASPVTNTTIEDIIARGRARHGIK